MHDNAQFTSNERKIREETKLSLSNEISILIEHIQQTQISKSFHCDIFYNYIEKDDSMFEIVFINLLRILLLHVLNKSIFLLA